MGEHRDVLSLTLIDEPHVALGMAAVLTSKHEAFAREGFGSWLRILVGQVNRDQYRFVLRGRKPVGFVDWFRTDRQQAERWLAEEGPALARSEGDCVVVNAVQADDAEVLAYVSGSIPRLEAPPFVLYAKRSYPDGRVRKLRLQVGGTGRARRSKESVEESFQL